MRDIDTGILSVHLSVHPSVRPSVTLRYCIETDQHVMILFSARGSPIILGFRTEHLCEIPTG